jgi:pimeloyl-ACP methyl ester carboxylesterase
MGAFQTRHLVVNGVQSPVLIGGTGATGEAVVFVHGNPDAGSDYTLAAYGAHLGGLIDQLGIGRVHLVAHDFGGPFALTWAAANPERVASVTLINSGVLFDYNWHRMVRVWRTPVAGELFMRTTTRRMARFVIRHDNPGLPREWADRIVEDLLPAGTKRAVLQLYRSTRQEDMDALVEPLRDRDHDTLVVFGAADVYILVEHAERQRRVFPRARVEILPGVGHWAWLEQPDQVARLVVPFLRERIATVVQKPN